MFLGSFSTLKFRSICYVTLLVTLCLLDFDSVRAWVAARESESPRSTSGNGDFVGHRRFGLFFRSILDLYLRERFPALRAMRWWSLQERYSRGFAPSAKIKQICQLAELGTQHARGGDKRHAFPIRQCLEGVSVIENNSYSSLLMVLI